MRREQYRQWFWVAILVVGSVVAGPWACRSATMPDDLDYADQAEFLYRQGEQALEGGSYIRATNKFNTVRNEYPYSRWAAEANLGIAEAYFEQGQYASAVQQYRGFIELHPRHPSVEYAHWKVALAFYEQMPSGFFLLPAPHERDLSSTRDAVRELEIFLNRFEASEFADEALQKWREASQGLATHEFQVAEFYYDRDNPRAAVNRLRHMLQNYSGLGLDAEALFLLGKAYADLGEHERARMAWTDLINVHTNHPRAKAAQRRLSKL